MKRPQEIRASPKDWIKVLEVAYPFLVKQGVGNPVLFGSQALSFYMEAALRSKDLDFVTDQVGPRLLDRLEVTLGKVPDTEVRSSSVQTKPFNGRKMRTYSVEMRVRGRPFFVEIFDAVLDGRSPSLLTPYMRYGRRWGLGLWVPEPSAVVALRLCFRQPEGISRLNAVRLNRFIKENRRRIKMREAGRILTEWKQAELVRENLTQLKRRHKLEINGHEEILQAVDEFS